MVDFSTPKRHQTSHRGNFYFIAALLIVGFVGYALLETRIHTPGWEPTSVSSTATVPVEN